MLKLSEKTLEGKLRHKTRNNMCYEFASKLLAEMG